MKIAANYVSIHPIHILKTTATRDGLKVLHIDDSVRLSNDDKMIEDPQDGPYHADHSFGDIDIIDFKCPDDHSHCARKPDGRPPRHADVVP